LHIRECGACAHRHYEAIAGVCRRTSRDRHWAAKEAGDEVGAALESAGREHDSAPRTHALRARIAFDLNPRDAPCGGALKPDGARFEEWLDTAVEASTQECSDEGLPEPALVTDATLLNELASGCRVGATERQLSQHEAPLVIGSRDPRCPGAKLGIWKRLAFERATTLRLSAWALWVVIGVAGQEREPNGGGGLEPADELRAAVDESADETLVHESM
jgi:hypothetical protein